MNKKLTGKQKLFGLEYIKDFNATQAATRAGYSEDCASEIGYENLRKPHVKAFIDELIEQRAGDILLDRFYVVEGIKDVVQKSMQAEPVLIDGMPTGEYRFDSQAALRGYELLGKHLKMFTDRVENVGTSLNVNTKPKDAVEASQVYKDLLKSL